MRPVDPVHDDFHELLDAFESPDPSDWSVGSAEGGWGADRDPWTEDAGEPVGEQIATQA